MAHSWAVVVFVPVVVVDVVAVVDKTRDKHTNIRK